MGRFDTTKSMINANVKTNGKQEITGQVMNNVLTQMVEDTDSQLTELESNFPKLYEATTTTENYYMMLVAFKKGDVIRVSVETTLPNSRIIICYNGANGNRLVDSANEKGFINNQYEVVCPQDINYLGLYLGTVGSAYTLKVEKDGKVAFQEDIQSIENDIFTEEFGGLNVLQDSRYWKGGYVSKGEPTIDIADINSYKVSIIPVIEGETLYYWFDGNRADLNTFIDGNHNRVGTNFTLQNGLNKLIVPNGAEYIALTIQYGASDSYKNKWLLKENSNVGKVHTQVTNLEDKVTNLEDKGDVASGDVRFILDGTDLYFRTEAFAMDATLDFNPSRPYNFNKIFNFTRVYHNNSGDYVELDDDVAPCHVINTTIGANHGQPCAIATIVNHGLSNKDVGTAWNSADGVFYVMRVVDADRVQFLSSNRGTTISPSFVKIKVGTITNAARTLTISSVADSQLYPSAHNITHKIYVDGKLIDADGTYYGNEIDVVETYDVIDPISVIENLVANVGNTSNPTFNGTPLLTYENIYRVTKDCNTIVFSNIIPCRDMAFADFMFAQSYIGRNFAYYIPNSLPINGYDFRKPLNVTWGSSIPSLYLNSSVTDDATKPINRVVTYGNNFGFALGYMPFGVGKDLSQYTNNTFEIRNTSGKIYPHGVDSKVGTILKANQMYSAVMLRSLINYAYRIGNRMSMYDIDVNGEKYIYIDYSASMVDKVEVNGLPNGSKIEVVESKNVDLLTDVYNQALYTNAYYVEGDTCYIVLKVTL